MKYKDMALKEAQLNEKEAYLKQWEEDLNKREEGLNYRQNELMKTADFISVRIEKFNEQLGIAQKNYLVKKRQLSAWEYNLNLRERNIGIPDYETNNVHGYIPTER
ncbi:hypothetical protein [Eubacterium sp. 1001713B170207_170306_E7]|uniref:hypothetical protein n=1 Tax=Eubacterium sp. 1001713B170207_170306_E7 TaxID=2787097 RepID=UPI00189B8C77|nr:hypothetical protein [Eubacterium sp. 1001713B170207_170306_E7]